MRPARDIMGPRKTSLRPALCDEGLTLVVTESFPPRPGGTSTVMRNLLSGYDPGSYLVVTAENARGSDQKVPSDVSIHYLLHAFNHWPYRISRRWRRRETERLSDRLVTLIKRTRPVALIGVFPDIHFLNATRAAALETATPWVLHAHDTIAESLSHTRHAEAAAKLQDAAFDEAAEVMVISEGMADLFKKKYGLEATQLEHIYPEAPPDPPGHEPRRSVFWGGQIYAINSRAMTRITRAAALADCTLSITSSQSTLQLEKIGVVGPHVEKTYYPRRHDYLDAIRNHGVLVLALDGPDESPVDEDELSTIFPTKTPEYLAAGRPILVHCPEHYFLARFFLRWGCGHIVSDRSVEALATGIRRILTHPEEARTYVRAAREALAVFSADRVQRTLREAVKRAVNGSRISV